MLKPWREVIVPHADVLKGTAVQADFAADISSVRSGVGPVEYREAGLFFARTFITEGMGQLLEQVALRLAGKGGEPVIQLQTAFGGGKTHTLLAVYHLATRDCPLSELPGVSAVVERAGLLDVPRANVAVLDGVRHSPGQPWKAGRQVVRTLWGELAYQLGKADGYSRVKLADETGTSPGKEVLRELLAAAAPCVVLLDELAVWMKNFEPGKDQSGGSYDSNLAFVQALTEAAKQVPTAVVLASLPDSAQASSGDRGAKAIAALEQIVGRVEAVWRPVATEEAFEIVRRRLFEPVHDPAARDAVCRAFADCYRAEGTRLPAETQEGRYADRLARAYPIHPEVFDRLYGDWSTLDGFQRTRGVLKLMATAVHRLWADGNADAMILPGSLPLADRQVMAEMTKVLPAGWPPVIEGDIDGDRAETTELEKKESKFGQIGAARRVARTLFLGTAPGSAAVKPGVRGLDRGRVLLGCLQPGQSAGVYLDALGRLADRLHYLNASGEKSQDATRFWFDTKANLRREMEDRKRRFDDAAFIRPAVERAVRKEFDGLRLFDGLHVFTPHADVPDDANLRLVVLPPEAAYDREQPRLATAAVDDYLRQHGNQPRHRANRLLFLAADAGSLPRLRELVRVALAWASIVDDVDKGQLNIDLGQRRQAEKERDAATKAVPRATRECFRWLLAPAQESPTAKVAVEAHPLETAAGTVEAAVERVREDNSLVLTEWSPIHLRTELAQVYWTAERPAVLAFTFWEDTQKYPYLPRLRDRAVLDKVVRAGAVSRDFFGLAHGRDGERYEGFRFGDGEVGLDDTLLLIEPAVARDYVVVVPVAPPEARPAELPTGSGRPGESPPPPPKGATRPKAFHGTADVPQSSAKLRMVQLAEEVINLLGTDKDTKVRVTVEITADFPAGVSDTVKRAVSENVAALHFRTADWE